MVGVPGIDTLPTSLSISTECHILSWNKTFFFLTTLHKICIHFSSEIIYLWQISLYLLEQKCHILADCYLVISSYRLFLCILPHFFVEHSEMPMKPRGHGQLPKSSAPGVTLKKEEGGWDLYFISWFYFVLFGKHKKQNGECLRGIWTMILAGQQKI